MTEPRPPLDGDHYRRLVEQVPAVIFELSHAIRPAVRYVSPAIETVSGYDIETWACDPDLWYRARFPADRVRVDREWEAAFEAGARFHSEYRLIRRDGSLVWVRETTHPITDAAGRVTGWQGVIVDISDVRFAEEAAARSEARYRNLVEHLPAVVYVDSPDIEPLSLYVSPSSTEILGYAPIEYLNDPSLWMRTIHPDDVGKVAESWTAAVHDGSAFAEEYRFVLPDGGVVWVRDTSLPVEDDEGDVVCWQGVILDITARKETEDELRASESRYRALVENVPATVYACTDESVSRTLYVSPRLDPALGLVPGPADGDLRPWEEMIDPRDLDRVLDAWKQAVRTGEPFDEEYRQIQRDGSVVWLHDVCRVVREGRDGAPGVRQGLMLDISHTKAVEDELRRSERRFRALVERLPVIVYLDTDPPETGTAYVSPNVLEILGYPAEWFLADASRWYDIVHPDDRDRVVATWRSAWRTEIGYQQEFRFVRPDGAVVWVRDSAHLVTEAEKGTPAWQGVFVDITARTLAEQELQSSEQRHRALVEQVPAIVYEMGPDDERHTLYVSPHVEALLGYSRQEWLDQPDIWMELLDEEDRETALAAHDLHTETREPWDREYRLIASDGRRVWVRDQATLVEDPVTGEARWCGVMLDITGQKDAEEALHLSHDELELRVLTRTAELEDANEFMTLEVAERRRAEEALRVAQQRYRDLVEALPAVVYSWETNWQGRGEEPDDIDTAPYMSPQLGPMLGYTPREFQETDFWKSRVHPHDVDRVVELAERSAATGEPFTAEYRYLAKDGRIVWVLDRATLRTRDVRGLPAHFQGVMLDVTARKEAEAKAEAAEERYRQLAEEGPVVSYLYRVGRGSDPPVDLEYMSPQVVDLLGYTSAELGSDPGRWLEIVHPDDLDAVTGSLERARATGEPWALEYRVIRRDGSIGWLRTQSRVVGRDDDGRPSRIQGAIMDVSTERALMAEIEASELHLRSLVEGLPAIPWTQITDPATGTERYTYIGPQSLEILGYTPEELLAEPTHFRRIVHGDDRARVAAVSEDADASGVWSDRFRAMARDGSVRYLRGAGRRTVTDDGLHVWHGVTFDETAWVVSVGDAAPGHARAGTDAASPEAPPSRPPAGGSPAGR
ncbi:MAG: PAS domain-containing protein [Actinomycetota bacterium]